MSIVDRIVDDSPYLLGLKSNDSTNFKDISVKQLNMLFDNTDFKDCINRIAPLYEGNYPDVDSEVYPQLLKDLDYLISPKGLDLLVLLHFSPFKEDILKQLNNAMLYEYEHIDFGDDLKETIISLGLIDLLKFKGYTFTNGEINYICGYVHINSFKYILEHNKIDIYYDNNSGFKIACRYENLDIFKHLYEITLKDGKSVEGDYKYFFECACRTGNVELSEYIWNLIDTCIQTNDKKFYYASHISSYIYNAIFMNDLEMVKFLLKLDHKYGRLSDNTPMDYIIHSLNRTINMDIIKYVYEFSLEIGISFNIHNRHGLLVAICTSGNLNVFKFLWNLISQSSSPEDISNIIHKNNNRLFRCACDSGNLELISYLQDISLEIREPFVVNNFLLHTLINIFIFLEMYPRNTYSKEVNRFLKTL